MNAQPQPGPQEPVPTEPDVPATARAASRRRQRIRSVAVLRNFQPHALAIEETPPSPFTGILLWSLAGLLTAGLLWSYLSQIPIMTTAPGKFVTNAHTKIVQSLNAGTVRGIFVKAGDEVSKGEILVRLDAGVDLAKLIAADRDLGLNRLQQQRILREIGLHTTPVHALEATAGMAKLEDHLAASQLAAQRSKLAVDRAQVGEAQANLDAGKATLAEYAQRAAQDTALAKAARPLVTEGALSGEHYTQLQDQEVVDEGQLATQRQQISQLSAALNAARKQLAVDTRTFEADRYQDLESSVGKGYDLKSQDVQAERDTTLDRLRAPVSGTVQTVEVATLGTVVQPGQTVATIVPSGAPLVVEADLPAQDVGFVKVGQKTQIKVTAYPFEQYGSIPGKVLWISPTAVPTSNLTSLPQGENHQPVTQPSQSSSARSADQTKSVSPPTLYYRIKVRPQRNWLSINAQHYVMRPGMTASLDIETGHRRVLDFFLDPVVKYLHKGLTVR